MNSETRRIFGDVLVELKQGFVALLTIQRGPTNFFDTALIKAIADALDWCDEHDQCRAVVLTSEGKHFCAGRAISTNDTSETEHGRATYDEAVRLFESKTPIIAAIQGGAIGGGLGLAMTADFRVCSPKARFTANFSRLGFHHGFGLTVTLPLVIGHQKSLDLLYTGRRINGEEATAMGLCDAIVEADQLTDAAIGMAADIAASAPLAVRSIRSTMRGHLAEQFRSAVAHEYEVQMPLIDTEDHLEGVRAYAERRPAKFRAR